MNTATIDRIESLDQLREMLKSADLNEDTRHRIEDRMRSLDQQKQVSVGQTRPQPNGSVEQSTETDTDKQTTNSANDIQKDGTQAAGAVEEEAVARTTKTEKSSDGGRTTTTTTTTTHRTKDGERLTTKQTRQITRVGNVGTTNYTINKSQADDIAARLASSFQSKSIPGLSGLITVRTETWNSANGLTVRSQKSQCWGEGGNQLTSGENMNGLISPRSAEIQPISSPPNFGVSPSERATVQRSATSIKQVLLDWVKSKVNHYEHVNVTNYSSSWSDGMAFCALIHNFHPEAFDYAQLNPHNRRSNFALAFESAEKYADIAPLLDVDDMVAMKNPDWKCVFTYLQSFYRRFAAPPTRPRPPQPPVEQTTAVSTHL